MESFFTKLAFKISFICMRQYVFIEGTFCAKGFRTPITKMFLHTQVNSINVMFKRVSGFTLIVTFVTTQGTILCTIYMSHRVNF